MSWRAESGIPGQYSVPTSWPDPNTRAKNPDPNRVLAGREPGPTRSVYSSIKKRKRVIKNSIHLSTQSYKKYNTDHYTLYNLNNSQDIASVEKVFIMSFTKYDNYHLFINDALDNTEEIFITEVHMTAFSTKSLYNTS